MPLYPTYAPEFLIKLDGQPLPTALKAAISSVTYEDGMQGADRVEVTIANPSLRWLDHPLLGVDTPFSLSIGYAPDPLEEVFVGEITGVEPTFPSGGMPTVRVTAQDFLNRLTHGTKDRAFRINIPSVGNFPLPDVAVASIVSAVDLLIPEPDPVGGALSVLMTLATFLSDPQSAQESVRRQEKQTDFDFLSEIARSNGWEVFIDHTQSPKGRILKFQFLIQQYTPTATLKWGSSLMEFTPRLTTVGDVFGVSARVWVDTLQMEFVIVVSWDYDRACFNLTIYPSLIGEVDDIVGSDAKGKVLAIDAHSYATAAGNILTELLPRLNNRLTGSGSCIGDPRIKASRVIRLDGLGDQFSGLYRITSATHAFDSSGYRTTFQVRKEVWFGSIPLPKAGRIVKLQGEFSA
jgi:phage protein D